MYRFIIFFSIGISLFHSGKPIDRRWCTQPLRHQQLVQDISGDYFVLDGYHLRKFTEQSLIKYYSVDARRLCIIPRRYFSEYPLGETIDFHPQQSLHQSSFLRKPGTATIYLWHWGRLHQLHGVSPAHFSHIDQQIYDVSALVLDSLPIGEVITAKTILPGSVNRLTSHCFLRVERGWCRLPYGLIKGYLPSRVVVSDSLYKKKPLCTLRMHFIDGSLVKTKQSLLYVIRSGKRYFLWNQHIQLSQRYRGKKILHLTRDEFYLIPFGGTVY